MEECVFCKIIRGELHAEVLYSSQTVLAIYDISPKAPTHILFLPKEHITDISLLRGDDILKAISEVTKNKDIKSYRLVVNLGKDAGQEIEHLHIHLLAGRKLGWPPG